MKTKMKTEKKMNDFVSLLFLPRALFLHYLSFSLSLLPFFLDAHNTHTNVVAVVKGRFLKNSF